MVKSYDDIKPYDKITKINTSETFGGWMEHKGSIQTRDVVKSIVEGSTTVPQLERFKGGSAVFEPKIVLPSSTSGSYVINPDAVIKVDTPRGTILAHIECKHAAKMQHERRVDHQVKALMEHKDTPSFYKKFGMEPPASMIGVLCSVAPFRYKRLGPVLRLIRDGLRYTAAH